MVSGVSFFEYVPNFVGKVEAKRTRGPVVVWDRRTGEGEDLPAVGAHTPSPLEVEAARLNMRPHFLAFVRAARGRVGASTRWRTSKRLQRARYSYGNIATFARTYGAWTKQLARLIWGNLVGHPKPIVSPGNRQRKKFQLAAYYMSSGRAAPSISHEGATWEQGRILVCAEPLLEAKEVNRAAIIFTRCQRARTPRPLYAMPRPPTCPCAPPVTC